MSSREFLRQIEGGGFLLGEGRIGHKETFFDKIHSTRLLLTNHARFFTINCILTV